MTNKQNLNKSDKKINKRWVRNSNKNHSSFRKLQVKFIMITCNKYRKLWAFRNNLNKDIIRKVTQKLRNKNSLFWVVEATLRRYNPRILIKK